MDIAQAQPRSTGAAWKIAVQPIPFYRIAFWSALAALLVACYFLFIPGSYKIGGIEYHFGIINGTVMHPFAQRVLLPFLLNLFTQDMWSVVYGMAFLYVILMIAAYMAVVAWMRTNGISERRAFVGIALLLLYTPVFNISNLGIAYSQLEILLIVLALFAMRQRWSGALIALIVVGTLNRETTGFYIVALYAMYTRNLRGTALYGALFGATYLIVRTAFPGVGAWQYGLAQWLGELEPEQFPTVVVYHTLFVPIWITALVRARHMPPLLRRVIWLIPLNLVAFFVFAHWVEVRLLMPAVFIVAVPLMLHDRRRTPADLVTKR